MEYFLDGGIDCEHAWKVLLAGHVDNVHYAPFQALGQRNMRLEWTRGAAGYILNISPEQDRAA